MEPPLCCRAAQLLEGEGRWSSARRGGGAGTGPPGPIQGMVSGATPPSDPRGGPALGVTLNCGESQAMPPKLETG